MGLSANLIFPLLLLSLLGSAINIPVTQVSSGPVIARQVVDFFGVRYVILRTAIVGYHPSDRVGMLRTYGTTDLARLEAPADVDLPVSVRRIGTYGSAVLLEV